MNVRSILKAALFTPGPKRRWGLPLIFEGKPGTGKTQRCETEIARFNMHCEVIIGSIREPTDVGGLARLFEDCFRLQPPGWAMDMVKHHQRSVVFFDELNTNVPAMQAALLRVLTDGAVGEMMLPPTVRFLAAMNKTEDAAGGWDLAPPLANRFGHLKWDNPEVTQWSNWLLGGTGEASSEAEAAIDAEKLEARVLKEFDSSFAKAKGLVAGFLKANPSVLHKMPPANSPEASRAWPSPRTWELCCRSIAGADVHNLDDVDSEELMAAFVGVGPAAELLQYKTKSDLPDPADVLDETVVFKHDPKRLDRTSAVLSSCAALIAPAKAPKRKERSDVLWRIIAEVSKDAADVTVQAGMVLAQNGFISGKDAYAALARLQPILAAAGFNYRKD